MKKHFLFLFAFFPIVQCWSQQGTWVRSLALTQYNYPASVWEVNGGKFMVCGTCGSDFQVSSHCFLLVDSNGYIIDSDLFGGQNYIEYNKNTYRDPLDSSYIVIGLTNQGQDFDYNIQVTKYSKQMQRLWSKQFGHSAWDAGLFVEGVGDGYILAGYLGDTLTNNTNAYLAKITLNGNLVWENELDWGKNEEWKCVKLLSDGNLMAIGKKEYAGGKFAQLIGKFTLNGDSIWTDTLMIKENSTGSYIEEIGGNELLLTGNAETSSDTNTTYFGLVQKIDMNGNLLWHWEYENFTANMIKQMADGYLISVGANTDGGFFDYESLTLRMYFNGLFSNAGTVGGAGRQEAVFMQKINNGNGMIVLAENAYGSPEIHNMLLYKTDSIGAFNASNDSAFISVGREINQPEQYQLFPNPSEGRVSISSNHNQKTDYFLYNEMGSAILQGRFSKHENLDLSSLPSGIYCIKLGSQYSIETHKLIIKH
jgi:hypothetical protein